MPAITSEQRQKLGPFLELGEKLGSLRASSPRAEYLQVEITYEGHVAEMKIKAITSAVLSGLLRPMLGDVDVVYTTPVVAKSVAWWWMKSCARRGGL